MTLEPTPGRGRYRIPPETVLAEVLHKELDGLLCYVYENGDRHDMPPAWWASLSATFIEALAKRGYQLRPLSE